MEQEIEIPLWEPESEQEASRLPWMLIDWHREGTVSAGGGLGGMYAYGEPIARRLTARRGLGRWLGERLVDSLHTVWLIPMDGARWFVFPHLYLATGHLLLAQAPAPDRYVHTMAKSGILDEIALFSEGARGADREPPEAMVRACQDVLRTGAACFPQSDDIREEAYRMLRAAAVWTGVRLNRAVTAASLAEGCAEAEADPSLLSAMFLMITSALARCRTGTLRVIPEQHEEGLVLSFKVPSVQSTVMLRSAEEIVACRALAESNCLLFDCAVRGKTFSGHLCVTRKDFALLGIKTENQMI